MRSTNRLIELCGSYRTTGQLNSTSFPFGVINWYRYREINEISPNPRRCVWRWGVLSVNSSPNHFRLNGSRIPDIAREVVIKWCEICRFMTELNFVTVITPTQVLPRLHDLHKGCNFQHNMFQLGRFMTLLISLPLIGFAPFRQKSAFDDD